MVNPIGMYDPANLPPIIVCDDLSDPTPCCGVGVCNLFCCNCDGGRCVVRLSFGVVCVGLVSFLQLGCRCEWDGMLGSVLVGVC